MGSNNRGRSQSDPDILSDSRVTLQIDSPQREKLKSRILSFAESTESTDSLSALFDEESDSVLSPLASPLANSQQYNQDMDLANLTQHYRSRDPNHNLFTSAAANDIIHEAISDDDCLSLNDINTIINTIDEEEAVREQKQAITRMIVGAHPRIISDDPMSTPSSLQSTNFSLETNDSQYTGFMKLPRVKSECQKIEEKCFEDEKEEEIHNAEEDESLTVTYSNSIEDLNAFHSVKAVAAMDEKYERKEDDVRICFKNKISEYQDSIKHLEDSAHKKTRRDSVTRMEKSHLVKSRRSLFDNRRRTRMK